MSPFEAFNQKGGGGRRWRLKTKDFIIIIKLVYVDESVKERHKSISEKIKFREGSEDVIFV